MSQQSQYFLFPDENLETSQIWKEAGFCPPMPFVYLIELLHKSEEYDISLTKPFDEAIFHALFDPCRHPGGNYHIYDTLRLKTMAQNCGIPVKDQEITDIAQELTRVILQDYGVYSAKNSRKTDIQ